MKHAIEICKERCKGCALCVVACAKGVLRMSKGLNKKGFHYAEVEDADACGGCNACTSLCPDTGIEIEREDGGDPPPEAPRDKGDG